MSKAQAAKDFYRTHVQIPCLKARARTHYLNYQRLMDSMDCGMALAESVSGSVLQAKFLFNTAMDELAEIDPSCPDVRL